MKLAFQSIMWISLVLLSLYYVVSCGGFMLQAICKSKCLFVCFFQWHRSLCDNIQERIKCIKGLQILLLLGLPPLLWNQRNSVSLSVSGGKLILHPHSADCTCATISKNKYINWTSLKRVVVLGVQSLLSNCFVHKLFIWFLSLEKLRSEELFGGCSYSPAVPIHPDLRFCFGAALLYSSVTLFSYFTATQLRYRCIDNWSYIYCKLMQHTATRVKINAVYHTAVVGA